jgi:hypothetical protein
MTRFVLSVLAILLFTAEGCDERENCDEINRQARKFVEPLVQGTPEASKRTDILCNCVKNGWVECTILVDGVPWPHRIGCTDRGCAFINSPQR